MSAPSTSTAVSSASAAAGVSVAGAAVVVRDCVARAFGAYSSVTSSMTAIGALSPLRGPILVIRV